MKFYTMDKMASIFNFEKYPLAQNYIYGSFTFFINQNNHFMKFMTRKYDIL